MPLTFFNCSPCDVALSILAVSSDQGSPGNVEILVSSIGSDGSFCITGGETCHLTFGPSVDWLVEISRAVMWSAIDMYRDEYIKHWWEWGHFFSNIFGYSPKTPHWEDSLRKWTPTAHERMRLAAAIDQQTAKT